MTSNIKTDILECPKTAAVDCFKSSIEHNLITIRDGVPVDEALTSALGMISSALEIIYADTDDHSEPVHGAIYLLEIAKGVVESCQDATVSMRVESERNNNLATVN